VAFGFSQKGETNGGHAISLGRAPP
jgi:hypothetical protein